MKKIRNETNESFVQIAIQKYKRQEVGQSGVSGRSNRLSDSSEDMSLERELMAPKQRNTIVRSETAIASLDQPLVENFFEQDDLFELSELKDPTSYIYFQV
jgi:hypothetical protein